MYDRDDEVFEKCLPDVRCKIKGTYRFIREQRFPLNKSNTKFLVIGVTPQPDERNDWPSQKVKMETVTYIHTPKTNEYFEFDILDLEGLTHGHEFSKLQFPVKLRTLSINCVDDERDIYLFLKKDDSMMVGGCTIKELIRISSEAVLIATCLLAEVDALTLLVENDLDYTAQRLIDVGTLYVKDDDEMRNVIKNSDVAPCRIRSEMLLGFAWVYRNALNDRIKYFRT